MINTNSIRVIELLHNHTKFVEFDLHSDTLERVLIIEDIDNISNLDPDLNLYDNKILILYKFRYMCLIKPLRKWFKTMNINYNLIFDSELSNRINQSATLLVSCYNILSGIWIQFESIEDMIVFRLAWQSSL